MMIHVDERDRGFLDVACVKHYQQYCEIVTSSGRDGKVSLATVGPAYVYPTAVSTVGGKGRPASLGHE
eukprot:scaffold1697_cov180-Amphora_coffeaeformis.AAC.23